MAKLSNADELEYQARCRQDDRRAQPRLRCKGVAELIVLSIGKHMPGTLLDLSVCGCCIETDAPLPSIENPAVEVQLAVNGITIRVAGVVRNSRTDHQAGIEFINVTKRKADQIKELVVELFTREIECRTNLMDLPEEALG